MSKAVSRIREPKTELEKKFCEIWLITYDPVQAWAGAGMPTKSSAYKTRAKQLAAQFMPYLEKRKKPIEERVQKRIAITKESLLQELAAVAMANPQDFLERYEELVETGKGKQKTTVAIQKTRLKNLLTMDRIKAAAVSEVSVMPDGTVSYKLPSPRERRPFIRDLGQHIGMFHQALIAENNHALREEELDLKDVETKVLVDLQEAIIKMLGPKMARRIVGPSVAEEVDSG